MRTALIWTNFGPYHYARAAALAARCELLAIELCSFERLYGWKVASHGLPAMKTLVEGTWEEQSTRKLSAALWRTLTKFNPDVVLVPGYANLPSISAALWGLKHRRTNVLMTESTADDHPREVVKERVKRTLVKTLFTHATVGGHRSAAYVEQLGIPKNNIASFYDVVDNASYREGTEKLKLTAQPGSYSLPEKYFLFVGRLAPEKNLFRLIDAFDSYRAGGGSWGLVLVGTGPLAKDLEARRQASPNRAEISFAGFKNGPELLPYYAFASCFILPSTLEPWGLVVNEAMASGLPVLVSTACGCSEDLVEDSKNGFLFAPTDVEKISSVMCDMERMPREQLDQMSAHSWSVISRYSPQAWANDLTQLLSRQKQGEVVNS